MRLANHLVAILFALAASACDSPRSPIDAHELGLAAKSLASLSTEAELLATELAAGSVTADFAWVHQQALADESLKVAKQLAKPVPPELRAAHEKISALNAQFQAEVTRIAQERSAPAQSAALQRDLQRLSGQAKSMEQQL